MIWNVHTHKIHFYPNQKPHKRLDNICQDLRRHRIDSFMSCMELEHKKIDRQGISVFVQVSRTLSPIFEND